MRHVFGCERQQIMKERLWFLEFLCANVTTAGRGKSNTDTEALLSVC